MTSRNPSLFRALLLLVILIVGPLHAQSVFDCPMMDVVMHGECCCVGHKSEEDCLGADCDKAVDGFADPCCERSVEVSIDEDAIRYTPIVKPVELRFDVDPPPAIAASIDELFSPPSIVAIRLDSARSQLRQSGSDTYLLTQRLRI